MSDFDKVIFGKKTFSDLLKDIYSNNKKMEEQIQEMILALKPFINSPQEAVMIVPLIKEYMDVQVKSNEHLVKMAAVVQRVMQSSASSGNDLLFPESEKEALLLELNNMADSQKQLSETIIKEEDAN